MSYILGISAYYHDSAACIVKNGNLVSAVQEERFTRKKHDSCFPSKSISYCLSKSDIEIKDIDYVVFYDKPLIKFERLLETYLAVAPRGFRSFLSSMPIWLKEKLYLKTVLKKELSVIGKCKDSSLPPLLFTEHHQAHAASAFYPSPFSQAAVLCMDGVGEWASTSVWHGSNDSMEPIWQINFPHSLGLLYSAFTYFAGFKVNSGEYKLMGLAPYGSPVYVDIIKQELLDIKEDGTYRMNMDYFNYLTGLSMTNEKFSKLFGGAPRIAESEITQREMDLAASIQKVIEEVILKIARTIKKEQKTDYLCMAGGVALNCVANGKLLNEKIFKDIWIQPASGDAGGAIGAALTVWYEYLGNKRENVKDNMSGCYLGPEYNDSEISEYLNDSGAILNYLSENELLSKTAKLISEGNVIGWFQGKMEFGPRALGGRSILGDPRNRDMQSKMNLKIKYRESFRPFAPSVLIESVNKYFNLNCSSPYMLLVSDISNEFRINPECDLNFEGLDKLKVHRSTLPAVTHVDNSARIQTVHKETNPKYYKLLKEFEKITDCGVLINTSFNVRGEPIVCNPEDAYRCFMMTEMDYLVIGNYLLDKKEQPENFSKKYSNEYFAMD